MKKSEIRGFLMAVAFAAKMKFFKKLTEKISGEKEPEEGFDSGFGSIKCYFDARLRNVSWKMFRARMELCYNCKQLGACLMWPECACLKYKEYMEGRPLTESELYPWREDPIWQQAMANLDERCNGAPSFEEVGYEMAYLRNQRQTYEEGA